MERKAVAAYVKDHPFLFVIEDGRVAEIHPIGSKKDTCVVGEIYIGKVKKILPNIQAAFIEIRPGMECYCALSDAKQGFFTCKAGKKSLCVGDELVVQVKKEAAGTKQPAVTANITLQGAYCILSLTDQALGVSAKIEKKKREQIRTWLSECADTSFGIIVRTNAAALTKEELLLDIRKQEQSFQTLLDKAKTRTCFTCLKKAGFPGSAALLGLNEETLTSLIVEDPILHESFHSYLESERPKLLDRLMRYEDALLPLHKLYSLEKELERALSEKIWMKSGAYLVIQPTEALTVIDVNSGKAIAGKKEQYLNINLEAAKEAAHQIRLRNLSGIILIDFINLSGDDERKALLSAMRAAVASDSVKTDVIDITKLELMEITRRKANVPLSEAVRKAGIKK